MSRSYPAGSGADRHLARAAPPSPGDTPFLRVFFLALPVLLTGVVALNVLCDPLARFGTGLLPPAMSADRDYKAGLYLEASPPPEIVVLGSSRVQTMDPNCIAALTRAPAFNFGVNAAGAEDLLAIERFVRSTGRPPRQLLVGIDPESLQESEQLGRPLLASRVLRPLVSAAHAPATSLGADLLGWQATAASLRMLLALPRPRAGLPQTRIRADGFLEHPQWDAEIRSGAFPQLRQVATSVPAIRGRYESFPRLSRRRVQMLDTLLTEAARVGIEVTMFIPPVHPALEHAATGSALPARTAETAALLQAWQAEGRVRYVETRALSAFAGDSTLYYDAIHMMPENTARLLRVVYQGGQGCALQ